MKSKDRARSSRTRQGIVFLILIIVVAMVLFSTLEQRMIYMPERAMDGDPSRIGLVFEDVAIRSGDGTSLNAWWIPRDGDRRTVLFLHGNAGNISHRLGRIEFLHRLGVSQLVLDYRGYGRSEGRPSEAGLYMDAEAAHRHLLEDRKIPPEQIYIFGKSLGGAVALDLARRVESAGLILESTFTSAKDMARHIVPFLPAHLILRSRFDSVGKIPDLSCPVLIIHGDADTTVPFEQGRRLFDAATERKDFLTVPGAGHNDVLLLGGDTYRDRLLSFLK